ncbi:DUF2252 domain-containing protein [Pseudonocardia xishanensis]|uniref:DUF2252 domain-containing protein n=1 Tax=Pseudonocardia xishanensis TaxID=630995 RepID=A0ABP8RH75_9PSEU
MTRSDTRLRPRTTGPGGDDGEQAPPTAPEPPRPSRAERAARGRALRGDVSRAGHAELGPDADREDPLDLLRGQDTSRVPELLPIRYGRMAVSPFAYYRGAALPMASDLSRTPRTGLEVQLCGDAHLANFGVFASPERRLVFDLNDFDETLPGPWEWDVKRLATSLEIAARENRVPHRARTRIVRAGVAAYRAGMAEFAAATALDVWYTPADVDDVRRRFKHEIRGDRAPRLEKTLAKARTRDNLGALARFAGGSAAEPRIIAEPPLIVPVSDLTETASAAEVWANLHTVVRAYRESLEHERRVLLDRYRLVDMARKVVGVGSVGTRSWMLLLLGDEPTDPLFLQAKEAGPAVLERYLSASAYENSGQRVVVGQRMMQAASDLFLGWVRVSGFDDRTRDFYIRQLRDWKGSADVARMTPKGLATYGELCGWTLARAHARTGDPAAVAGYLGSGTTFDKAVAEFASAYADRNERDHAALVAAIGAGLITAASA